MTESPDDDRKKSQNAFRQFLEQVEIDDELAEKIQKRIRETPRDDDD